MEESLTENDPGKSFTITRRNGTSYTMLVSAGDFERVMAAGKWCAVPGSQTTYAAHGYRDLDGRHRTMSLHRFILNLPFGSVEMVDHVNRNGLDNRRCNLRIATKAQNAQNIGVNSRNTSGFKGVCWHRQEGKWYARINVNGRQVSLGLHATVEEAAAAYREAAIRLHKEFARF